MRTQQAVGGLPSEDQHCDVDTAGCWKVRGLPSEDQHCDADTAGCWGIAK